MGRPTGLSMKTCDPSERTVPGSTVWVDGVNASRSVPKSPASRAAAFCAAIAANVQTRMIASFKAIAGPWAWMS